MKKFKRLGNDYLTANAVYQPGRLLDFLTVKLKVANDKQLAEALHVPQSYVCKIRNRHMSITAAVLLRIHDVTGFQINELREMAGIPVPKFEPVADEPMKVTFV